MSYNATLNGKKFFDTAIISDALKLTQARLKVPESFNFMVTKDNICYKEFHKLVDIVDVYRDDDAEPIFSGRVIDITQVFDKQYAIECEDLLAVLNDSMLRPVTYENMTNREVFAAIIANHNSQMSAEKQFRVGRVTVDEAACYRPYKDLEKTLERLKNLTESFGGRLRARHSGGYLYIDWLKAYDEGCEQVVDFGSNLLDLKENTDARDVVTYLIPYGAKIEGEEDKRVDITSVTADGRDYVTASSEYLQKYKEVWDTAVWDDVTVPDNLKAKAEAYLDMVCKESITINVTAVDLADAGYDVESFRVGQRIRVRSAGHDIDDFFDCTEQTLDLLNSANNRLTLGTAKTGFVATAVRDKAEQQQQLDRMEREQVTNTQLQAAVEKATDQIIGNNGGYVVFRDSDDDGQPDEILIMDTPDINTAVKVWRFNKSGLGFSSTGYNGDYGLAMTIDGEIVADMITAGTMNAERVKTGILQGKTGGSYWNLDTGEIHIENSEAVGTTVFLEQPAPPYKKGDLWIKYYSNNAIADRAVCDVAIVDTAPETWVCLTDRASGTFREEDWGLASNYLSEEDVNSRITGVVFEINQKLGTITSEVTGLHDGSLLKSIINQDASSVTIDAQNINLNGAVSANGFFKILEDGTVEIAGASKIDITTSGEQKSGISLKYNNYELVLAPGMLQIWSGGKKRHQFLGGNYMGYDTNGNITCAWNTTDGVFYTQGKPFSGTTSANGFLKIADKTMNVMYVSVATKLTNDFCFCSPIWAYDNYSSNKGYKTYLRFFDGYGNPLANTAVSGTYY